ncbi:MAG TPA: amino acid adenylation domain-containing protein, partial [Pyrinomonadaceae bacterium]|nr:amino acid adenylation domain-containing protein [Pyrinomonadaceae bacterium]
TLVMRTDLSGDPGFRELLGRVKEVALGAYAHQDLPFEKLVEAISPERDTSRNPLFQVSFQLSNVSNSIEDASREAEELADESQLQVEKGAAKFDLGVNVWESERGLRVQVDYSTDLFDDVTIRRMLKHFERLLEGVAADPNRRISQLPLLTAEEQQQILVEWNDVQADYARHSCLHELFEAQVERTPDSVAVSFAGEQLTYAELNARANQVARRLRRLGVCAEISVGICMERSVEMVVGMLGILKAGGAYVPLDSEYPAQRLSYMIVDAGVRVLLTQERLAQTLLAHGATVLRLDADRESIAVEDRSNLEHRATAENPAYVIYTSGSTGTPKGVVVTHSAVARTVCNTNYIKLEPLDRVAQASNSSFDAATFEIWGALLHGATLVVIPKEVLISPRHLAEQIRELGISVMFLPTALFNQVAGEVPGAFSSLRCLLFGGEAVDPRSVREVLKSEPPQRLVHVYGPTESTTYALWHQVENLSAEATTVAIGRPLSNTQIFLLDEYQQPVPVGVSGELYIGGDGLARGYLNRPSLTAERFIPNPFTSEPGKRLYRTGDEARFLANAEIEFLGRRDEQVKIRGYRIELGEIEAQLREDREVREAVVMAREDMGGEKRLVAYVVADQGNGFSVSELRRLLGERLPEYMLPSAFVLLEQLPLTANGKVDRGALPEPSQHHEAASIYVPPRTELERLIAATWQEVFRVEKLSVHSNFFDLGGHSLTLVRVHSMLRNRLHKEISMIDMFRYPTIRSLSDYLSREQSVHAEVASPRYQQIYDRAEKQKDALSRRKQAMQQRAMTNE